MPGGIAHVPGNHSARTAIDDADVPGQRVFVGGFPVFGEVGRGGADHHSLRGQAPCGERAAIRQAADAHGQVVAFFNQIDDLIGKRHFHLQARMSPRQREQDRRRAVAAEQYRGADAQRADRFPFPAVEDR